MTTLAADVAALVAEERRAFAERNPESRRLYEERRRHLPGGHTRTILHHEPFPLTFVRGEGAVLTDADGHEYVDLLGDYTAGLFGHGERRVIDAVHRALRDLSAVGGIHPHEALLARLMCERFGVERVRFTNSGTEANLMAITAARMHTGRSKILVFHGGYHGGVLHFGSGVAAWNAPYEFVVAPYNDLDAATALVDDDLAAVLVEPMLGSGGCIPAQPEFLQGLFAAARDAGAVTIADEVMTSRHGPRGLAALLGAEPDLRTFGKYIGGGFSFGAFGGRAEVMDLFDTARPGAIPHAGTFNNNVATMTAGRIVLGDLYTADVAEAHTERGERFRARVADVLSRRDAPVSVTGYGSMLALHAGERQELLFLGLYKRGVYIAPRGMVNLSLPVTDDQLDAALAALDETLA